MVRQTAPRRSTYLLTIWQERGREPDQPLVWRFSLEEPRTGRRRGFATLKELVAALEASFTEVGPGESKENPPSPARGPPDT